VTYLGCRPFLLQVLPDREEVTCYVTVHAATSNHACHTLTWIRRPASRSSHVYDRFTHVTEFVSIIVDRAVKLVITPCFDREPYLK
jgi:hypothetical protein